MSDDDIYAPAPRSAELAAKFRDGTKGGEIAARIVERRQRAFDRKYRAIQDEALARALKAWGFDHEEEDE